MKKFLKIFIPIFLIVGGLALAICYMVIPQETKSAADIVVGYLNTPLGIVGGTTVTLGLVVVVIVKFVLGKNNIDLIHEIDKAQDRIVEVKEEQEKYYELAKKEKEETIEILNSFSTRIDDMVDKVCLVCETIPNAKVKVLGEKFRQDSENLKKDLTTRLEERHNSLLDSTKSLPTMSEINEQLEQLKELIKKAGLDNEREETTND